MRQAYPLYAALGIITAFNSPAAVVKAAASHSPSTVTQCRVAAPWTCADTNKLVWAKGFSGGLSRFLGKKATERVSLLYPGELQYQLADALGGPPDDRQKLADGSYLFTACRPHSCSEKGAITFDAGGSITAIAIVNYHCGEVSKTCSNDPALDIYTRNLLADSLPLRAIVGWARRETADDAAVFHEKAVRLPIIHKITT